MNKGLTGLERGWVIIDRFFIFEWTIPLIHLIQDMLSKQFVLFKKKMWSVKYIAYTWISTTLANKLCSPSA